MGLIALLAKLRVYSDAHDAIAHQSPDLEPGRMAKVSRSQDRRHSHEVGGLNVSLRTLPWREALMRTGGGK